MDKLTDRDHVYGGKEYKQVTLSESTFAIEDVTIHEKTGTATAQFDPESGQASLAVVSLIAELTDRDPRDLSVLYGTVDPDSLDTLFADRRTAEASGTVSFSYEGYRVTVSSGSISLTPAN